MRKLLTALLILVSLPCLAQETDPYLIYLKEAGWDMPLYRGRTAIRYNFSYNGTYFWDLGGFRRGDLCYAGKVYRDMEMNINAHLQRLLIRFPDSFSTVDLGNRDVAWFTLEGERFVNLRAKGLDVPEGFYRAVYEGQEAVYERIDKEFRRDINSSNDGEIGYRDPDYKEGVYEIFAQRRTWYFVDKNGQATRFKKQNALLKAHPDRKRDVTRYLKEQGLDKADFATWCAAVMNYIEHGK